MTGPFLFGNMLLDARGDAWGVYRVPTASYPLLPDARKRELHERLASFAHGAGNDFTLWRVTRLAPDAPQDTIDQRTVECYAAIRLNDRPLRGLGQWLLRRVPMRLALARTVLTDLTDQEREQRTHAHATLHARPATTRELTWLVTRTPILGAGEPSLDPNDDRAALHIIDTDTIIVEPVSSRHVGVHRAQLVEHDDRLEITTPNGPIHHAALAVGVLPDELEFPGQTELALRAIEQIDAPVDWVIHARWVANAKAIKHATRLVVDADNVSSEQASTGRVADSRLQTQLDTALDYKRYLESTNAPPILTATLTLVVAAPTPERLDHACTQLAVSLAPLHVIRQRFVQHPAWQSAQQPARRARGARAQHLTVEQLGALMPIATEYVGTPTGPVIGRIRTSGRPVRLDVGAASRASRPPSILCVGSLGSGKTMTGQLIAYQALQNGSVVIDVDPKPDHKLDTLPDLAGRCHVIDLADVDQYAGLLDPLRITDPAMRTEMAASFYGDLLDATPKQRAHLRSALADLPHTATSHDLIQHLAASTSTDARDTAEQLRAWAAAGLARLALAPPTASASSSQVQHSLTSIRCRTLQLPDAVTARSDYTEAERVSCAIMRLIAAYALRLALADPAQHALVMVDEAWLLLSSSDGRMLIDRINRTGRSEHASLVLSTQQLGDAAHAIPLIGTRLVFGLETRDEATQASALLGIDDTDANAELIQTQRTGQALMRDLDGNIARIQIDVPAALLAHLSTTPTTQEGARG